jgi:hypothetical protein
VNHQPTLAKLDLSAQLDERQAVAVSTSSAVQVILRPVEVGALVRIQSVDGSDLREARLLWPNTQVGDTLFHEDRPWFVVEVIELDHGRCSACLRVRPHLALESHIRIRARFGTQLVEDVRSVVNRHDLEGLIAMECPENEYEPEIEDILAQLQDADTVADATVIVREVFTRCSAGISIGPHAPRPPSPLSPPRSGLSTPPAHRQPGRPATRNSSVSA